MEKTSGADRGVTLRAVLEPRAGGKFCGRGAFQPAMKGDNMPPSAPTRGGCAAARVEGRRSKVEGWENTWRLRGGQKEASRKGQPGKRPPKAAPKPSTSHLQAGCMGGASGLLSYSLRIPFVFSSYSLGVLHLFSGGALRGAMAVPSSPCLSSTPLVCPLFKRNRIFHNRNDSGASPVGNAAELVDLVKTGGDVELP